MGSRDNLSHVHKVPRHSWRVRKDQQNPRPYLPPQFSLTSLFLIVSFLDSLCLSSNFFLFLTSLLSFTVPCSCLPDSISAFSCLCVSLFRVSASMHLFSCLRPTLSPSPLFEFWAVFLTLFVYLILFLCVCLLFFSFCFPSSLSLTFSLTLSLTF